MSWLYDVLRPCSDRATTLAGWPAAIAQGGEGALGGVSGAVWSSVTTAAN